MKSGIRLLLCASERSSDLFGGAAFSLSIRAQLGLLSSIFSPVTQTVEQPSRLPCPHSWGHVCSRVSHPIPSRAPSVARHSALPLRLCVEPTAGGAASRAAIPPLGGAFLLWVSPPLSARAPAGGRALCVSSASRR